MYFLWRDAVALVSVHGYAGWRFQFYGYSQPGGGFRLDVLRHHQFVRRHRCLQHFYRHGTGMQLRRHHQPNRHRLSGSEHLRAVAQRSGLPHVRFVSESIHVQLVVGISAVVSRHYGCYRHSRQRYGVVYEHAGLRWPIRHIHTVRYRRVQLFMGFRRRQHEHPAVASIFFRYTR
jgi:hypothetical protein